MPLYSHSKLNSYENCPLKYKLSYIDGIKRDTKGVEAFVGTIVHDTLQKCYDDAKQSKVNTLDELLAFYENHWRKEWNDSIIIVRKEYTVDDYMNRGAQMLTGYYNRFAPFASDITIATEMPTVFELGKHKLRGFIDRLSRKGDVYQIHDYKTSAHLPGQSEADADRQLALYQIGIKQKWPHIKNVELIWHYLAFDEDLVSTRTDDSISKLVDDTVALIEQIEGAVDFPAKQSALCNWCEYPDLCPLRKHFHAVESLSPSDYLSETGVSLANKYAELKEKEGEIKAEMEDVKSALIDYAKREQVEVIKGSDKKVTIKFDKKLKLPGKSDENRVPLDEMIRDAGKWDDVSQLDTDKLGKIIQGKLWDDKLMEKLGQFTSEEERSNVRISKLKEQEK